MTAGVQDSVEFLFFLSIFCNLWLYYNDLSVKNVLGGILKNVLMVLLFSWLFLGAESFLQNSWIFPGP